MVSRRDLIPLQEAINKLRKRIEQLASEHIEKRAPTQLEERIRQLEKQQKSLRSFFQTRYQSVQPRKQVPRIALVVTTKNLWEYTEQCLRTLYKFTELPFNLIIVDGASTDGTPDNIRKLYPDATFIELDRSYWVSYAWNAGLKEALQQDVDFIGILNNDLIFCMYGWLKQLLKGMDNPNVGLVGPRVMNADGTIQAMGRNALGWGVDDDVLSEHLEFSMNTILPVSWIQGSCLVARVSAIHKVGMFDDRFMFCGDDVDWCLRFWQAGYEVVVSSWSTIIHLGSATFKAFGGEKQDLEKMAQEYGREWINCRELSAIKHPKHVRQRIYDRVKAIQDVFDVQAIIPPHYQKRLDDYQKQLEKTKRKHSISKGESE